MKDVMLDLETLGNRSNAAIISIGAVFFDISTGDIGDKFYTSISLESSLRYGDVDGSTLAWWMKQSSEAQSVFNDAKSVPLLDALAHFSSFIGSKKNSVYVWGNGATFDNVILSNAYVRASMPRPWHYSKDCDVRTLAKLGRDIIGTDFKEKTSNVGTAHNALDDAIFQVKWCSQIYKSLRESVMLRND
jgi:exodeoxyribonuclease VIII